MRLSGDPPRPEVWEAHTLEPNVSHLRPEERIGGPRKQDRVPHLAGDHRELAHPQDDLTVRDPPIQPVEDPPPEGDDRGLFSVGPNTVHELRARFDGLVERSEQLGRVFAVDIDHRVEVALGAREARDERRVVAEVPRERNHLDARVDRSDLENLAQRVIVAAVIDEHHLPVHRVHKTLQCRHRPPVEGLDVGSFVVHWDYHGQLH